MEDIYYHGTDAKGINGILESGKVGFEYFDGFGVYLTKEFDIAHTHGQYVLSFSKIDKNNLETDDVNDGILHRGKIDYSLVDSLIIKSYDRRIVLDLINNICIEKNIPISNFSH